jgi:hypothetical protein
VRKRLIVGAIVVLVTGVAGYVISQQGHHGVEYHTQNYWAAFYGTHRLDLLRIRVTALMRRTVTWRAREERRERRLADHEARLIKLGYLEERSFDVFGNHPNKVVNRVTRQEGIMVRHRNRLGFWDEASFRLATTQNEIVRVTESGPFSVLVIAPKANMAEWEERIRRADRADSATK